MSEFKIIETQEDFEAAIKSRLDRDRKTYQKTFEEELKGKGWKSPEEIAELTKDLNSQIDKLNNAAAETAKTLAAKDEEITKNAKYRAELEKTRIAIAAGLNIDFAERLKGETAEEWKKDAANLAKVIRSSVPGSAPLGNPEGGSGKGSTRDQFANWFSEITQ